MREKTKDERRKTKVGFSRGIFILLVLGICIGFWVQARKPALQPAAETAVRFGWVDVSIDSGSVPLGAYQFELAVERGKASVVGLEGGTHPAFAAAPYYDAAALQHERVIVAAYSVADVLPVGKTRVARVMLEMHTDDVAFAVKLTQALGKDGQAITAKIDYSQGEAK